MDFSEQLAYLIRLQRVETEASSIERKLDRMPEKKDALEKERALFQEAVEAEKGDISGLQKQYRSLEMDVRNRAGLLEKSRSKLHSAKSNKEYQSCLKEIEDIERKTSELEDRMIEILEAIESGEEKFRGRQAECVRFSGQVQTDLEQIDREAGALREEMTALAEAREAVIPRLEVEMRDRYVKIRDQQVDRVALVQVVGGVCQGCHMNIPPQMYNELQRCDSLKFCPFCNRMLYWKNE